MRTNRYLNKSLYIGLMSGTSLDAIDVALCRFTEEDTSIIEFQALPLPEQIRSEISTFSHSMNIDIELLAALDIKLGRLFSEAALGILKSTSYDRTDIAAIGSHGQTIRHKPKSAETAFPFSLQIGDPNTIAETTGITTIADFRRRDIAAGGEGAPLVPAFHQAVFSSEKLRRVIVNIGGFANVTLLDGNRLAGGFDTGPGNSLLDSWIMQHLAQPFDSNGDWAGGGKVNEDLLGSLLSEEYFLKKEPKSTGKELFNMEWLNTKLQKLGKDIPKQDVQSTLSELTAKSICMAISDFNAHEVYICGGGAHNTDLFDRIRKILATTKVESIEKLGFEADHIEAAAFAWLSYRTLHGLTCNSPISTGASGDRILGAIFQA